MLSEQTKSHLFDQLEESKMIALPAHGPEYIAEVGRLTHRLALSEAKTEDEAHLLSAAAMVWVSEKFWRPVLEKQDLLEKFSDNEASGTIRALTARIFSNKKGHEKEAAIMEDAINAYMGRVDFDDFIAQWMVENLSQKGLKSLNTEKWLRRLRKDMKKYSFQTRLGKELFERLKKENRKRIKVQVRKKVKEKEKFLRISSSRTAQMMFKTALRNHIDLTNIADNKANIMLSINAIVITILIPLLAPNVQNNLFLLYPASVLMMTCLGSIIFATLATRPIQMAGSTNIELLGQQNSNLFFFGNFYKMSLLEYQDGLQKVVGMEEELEKSIMNDLYFLGKALGRKYHRLRICYSIFMYGVSLTVLAFAIAFFFHMNAI